MLTGPNRRKIWSLTLLTFGFYFFYWCAHSRSDVNRSAQAKLVPTTWLLAVPGGNYYWMWKYAEALEFVSFRRIKKADTFLLYMLTSHAWLLLTFGLEPNFNAGWRFNNLVLAIFIGYLVACVLLEILGAAFFCATTQRKISIITRSVATSPTS